MTTKTPRPDWVKNDYPSYSDLVTSTGYEVLEWMTFGCYQGDYFVLLGDDTGRRGFLVIGYGSCSVCDTLESVTPWHDDDADYTDLVQLRDNLLREVRWEDSARELANTILNLDPGNEWYLNEDEAKSMVERFVPALLNDQYSREEVDG